MSTFYVITGWVLLVANLVLLGVIRSMKRRHDREVRNLVDDSLTFRDKNMELRKEIRNYQRQQLADGAIVDKLLQRMEKGKEERMEMGIRLAKYRSLVCFAYERAHATLQLMSPAQYQIMREAMRQLYNLETKPDAGKRTTPGDGTGEGPAVTE